MNSYTNIQTFALRKDVLTHFRTFPQIHPGRFKFLAKPLNWFVGLFKPEESFVEETIQRIVIDKQKTDEFLLTVLHEHRRFNSTKVQCFVIGFDFYHKLMTDTYILQHMIVMDYSSPTFRGVKLVLHPSISGAVPLDFAP